MRVAALYDIHGNLPALETVLQDVYKANVDRIVIGGDVLPGPMPRQCLDCLQSLAVPVQFIHGNGDREVLAQLAGTETDWYRNAPAPWREPVHWTARQLDSECKGVIADWPATCNLEISGLGKVLFCHATPRNDTEIFTRLTAEDRLLPIFESLDTAVVICGHTHMQFDRMISRTRVVNAGSVGMPFGDPGAYWLLLGSEIQLRRTSYDLEAAAKCIRHTTYPRAEDFAAENVLQPPSEEKTLAAFAKVELR